MLWFKQYVFLKVCFTSKNIYYLRRKMKFFTFLRKPVFLVNRIKEKRFHSLYDRRRRSTSLNLLRSNSFFYLIEKYMLSFFKFFLFLNSSLDRNVKMYSLEVFERLYSFYFYLKFLKYNENFLFLIKLFRIKVYTVGVLNSVFLKNLSEGKLYIDGNSFFYTSYLFRETNIFLLILALKKYLIGFFKPNVNIFKNSLFSYSLRNKMSFFLFFYSINLSKILDKFNYFLSLKFDFFKNMSLLMLEKSVEFSFFMLFYLVKFVQKRFRFKPFYKFILEYCFFINKGLSFSVYFEVVRNFREEKRFMYNYFFIE